MSQLGHKVVQWSAIGVAIVFVIVVTVGTSVFGAPPPSDLSFVGSVRSHFKLPKLFDFENYKLQFEKRYASKLEEMARKNWFVGRAFRVFISSIRYKQRLDDSYKSLNPLSDRSASELSQMSNQVLTELMASSGRESAGPGHEPEQGSGEPLQDESTQEIPHFESAELERQLTRLATLSQSFDRTDHGHENPDDPDSPQNEQERQVLEILINDYELHQRAMRSGARRDRRHIGSGRELPIQRLINADNSLRLNGRTARRLNMQPKSNNPLYIAPDWGHSYMYEFSFGLRSDNLTELEWSRISPKPQMSSLKSLSLGLERGKTFLSQMASYLMLSKSKKRLDEPQPDQVFLDHRDSDCLFMARDQGQACGCCYAFATIALAEWWHCNQTGELSAFSEQYIIDCGNPVGHKGCEGGHIGNMGNFIQNYGLQLHNNYKFEGKQNQCPYNEDTHPSRMGYIRMNLVQGIEVPLNKLDQYIKLSPIIVSLAVGSDFYEYGGGVFSQCRGATEGHAALIVGHGREDNKDYWLLRNSYGVNWGDKGHMKLWKKATKCFGLQVGVIYGRLSDAHGLKVEVTKNQLYDKEQFMASRQRHLEEINKRGMSAIS